MTVSPELVVFAIRAAMRIGRAAQLELENYIRNRPRKMPLILTIKINPIEGLQDAIQKRGLVDD